MFEALEKELETQIEKNNLSLEEAELLGEMVKAHVRLLVSSYIVNLDKKLGRGFRPRLTHRVELMNASNEFETLRTIVYETGSERLNSACNALFTNG